MFIKKSLIHSLINFSIVLLLLINVGVIGGGLLITADYFHEFIFNGIYITVLERKPFSEESFGYKVYVESELQKSGIVKSKVRIEDFSIFDFLYQYPESIPLGFLIDGLKVDEEVISAKAAITKKNYVTLESNDSLDFLTTIEVGPEKILDLPVRIEPAPTNLWKYSGNEIFIWIDNSGVPTDLNWDSIDELHFELEAYFKQSGISRPLNSIKAGEIDVSTGTSLNIVQFLGINKMTAGQFELPDLIMDTQENYRPSILDYKWTSNIEGKFISPDELIGAAGFMGHSDGDLIDANFVYELSGLQWLPYLAGLFGIESLFLWQKLKRRNFTFSVRIIESEITRILSGIRLLKIKLPFILITTTILFCIFSILLFGLLIDSDSRIYKKAPQNGSTPWLPIEIEIPEQDTIQPYYRLYFPIVMR